MSSFVVGTDHIDYLVSAVLMYAPLRLGSRSPDELGRQLLSENVATVAARYLDVHEEGMSSQYLAELAEERAKYVEMVRNYTFRKVDFVEPAQAAQVAVCWQSQQDRDGPYVSQESWATANEVIAAALAVVGLERLKDPAGPRTIVNLLKTDLAWQWTRERDRG